MSEAQHTPGPWAVSPFYAGVITDVFGKDGDFLPVAKLLWPTDERSESETYANGSLIAAAPDLLAAAIEMLPTNIALGNGALPDSTVVPIDFTLGELRALRAAIAKARPTA